MTASDDLSPVGHEILARLDCLTDLFRRRLEDDRDKRRLIDELSDRLRDAESGPFRQYLSPFVNSLALVLDRLNQYTGPDQEFASSIRTEIIELLATHGVVEVPHTGLFDPSCHQVVSSRPEPDTVPGTILEIHSCGLAHGSWVFRAARVIVAAPQDAP